MTQPQPMREPEDGRIERWLTERQRQLPPADREVVLGGALRRLPQTPQRRRWRLLKWLPFGIGATRSSVPAEPRPEGSTRMILSATRVTALLTVLALGSGLALVAGPLPSGSEVPGGPALEAPGPEAASSFSGTGTVSILEFGEQTTVDGVGYLEGHVSTIQAETVEVTDPRVEGTQTWIQHGLNFGDFGPAWGPFRIENDDGAWVGEVSGAWDSSWTGFAGWLTGEDAYEGLVLYYRFDVGSGVGGEFRGVIYPADTMPVGSEVG